MASELASDWLPVGHGHMGKIKKTAPMVETSSPAASISQRNPQIALCVMAISECGLSSVHFQCLHSIFLCYVNVLCNLLISGHSTLAIDRRILASPAHCLLLRIDVPSCEIIGAALQCRLIIHVPVCADANANTLVLVCWCRGY